MRTLHRTAALLAAVVLTATACASGDDVPAASTSPSPADSGTATAAPTAGPTASAVPSPGGGALPDDLRTRPEVAAAIEDAASRQGVAPEQVSVVAWSPVTWTDGSLGCPQKGMAYTQALVAGELLVLGVDQAQLQYHSGRGGPFAYCASPSAGYSPNT